MIDFRLPTDLCAIYSYKKHVKTCNAISFYQISTGIIQRNIVRDLKNKDEKGVEWWEKK